jgi:hypothetical protein
MNRTIAICAPITALAFMSLDACSDNQTAPPGASSGSSSSSGGASSSSGGASSSSGGASSSSSSGGGSDAGDASVPEFVGPDGGVASKMNFFVTSKGNGKGGDFRAAAGDADGLAGADAFCKSLAEAVSPVLGAKTWRAYLSTNAVTARSRIGNGPFYNAKGTVVASSVALLHDEGGMNMLSGPNSLDELGNTVPTNVHDVLTGTLANGSAAPGTCSNWTSSAAAGVTANVGHCNRQGGGAVPTSWNAAHGSAGCSVAALQSTGGRGSIYCFAQ